MNTGPNIVLLVLSVIVLASLIEAIVLARHTGGGGYDWRAAGVSLLDAVVRQLIHLIPVPFIAVLFEYVYSHRIATIEMDAVWAFALLFIGQEFCYYWYHRAAHRVRWFWCTHAIHHSPNDLNLSAAYRFGWTGRLTGTLLFFLLAPLLGAPPRVIVLLLSLNLLYQFWIHATWIPRLGPLEWVLNTPSAHRVHHAANLEYLDGNYGGVLIVFDRLFGTYIPERADLKPRYGLVKPLTGYNLLTVEFGQWRDLWRDLRSARSVGEALGYLWRPPGWRPGGGETTEELRQRAALAAEPPTETTHPATQIAPTT